MSNLYIVATPIGNLEDITLRAIEILKQVDLIACEDTRQTKKILNHYNISTSTVSYHQHSKLAKIDYLLNLLKNGKDIAVVTDAGTPAISDPGGILVKEAVDKLSDKVKIIPIPGASACISALSICGFPLNRFLFLGFLPHKKGRETFLKEVINSEDVVVFYESCHRILKMLKQLQELDGSDKLQLVICRELTKMFESVYRGSVDEVLEVLESDVNNVKGEFAVVAFGAERRGR
ncbi:MAG: 16S rRNA (cytidine(1402)-2'-O)-methyltransferase [bacterium]